MQCLDRLHEAVLNAVPHLLGEAFPLARDFQGWDVAAKLDWQPQSGEQPELGLAQWVMVEFATGAQVPVCLSAAIRLDRKATAEWNINFLKAEMKKVQQEWSEMLIQPMMTGGVDWWPKGKRARCRLRFRRCTLVRRLPFDFAKPQAAQPQSVRGFIVG